MDESGAGVHRLDGDGATLGDLQPVEQAVADVNPIGRSLRLLEPGLRLPTGFSEVYPVPGRPGWFMRVNGGLYVVFPESIYAGNTPLIPDNALFYIGPPAFLDGTLHAQTPEEMRDDAARVRRRTTRDAVDPTTAASTKIGTYLHPVDSEEASGDQAESGRTRPSIIRDRTYRAQRLISLMQRALARERNEAAGGTDDTTTDGSTEQTERADESSDDEGADSGSDDGRSSGDG